MSLPPPALPQMDAGDVGTGIVGLGICGCLSPSASSPGIHGGEGLGEGELGDFRKKKRKK